MDFCIIRDDSNDVRTLGSFEFSGRKFCDALENPHRDVKVDGETRFKAGVYPLALNTEGNMNKRYKELFPTFHVGMIEICDIPDFTWVYIHIGNFVKDTDGCPVVGFGRGSNNNILRSREAYIGMYLIVTSWLAREPCRLIVLDKPPKEVSCGIEGY